MKRLIRSVAAAALATAFTATPALAHDRDHDRDRDDRRGPPVVVYEPAPRPARSPVRWQRRELRREYAELEAARDRFYATWNGNPWQARRFERWYAFRKSELDQRWIARASW